MYDYKEIYNSIDTVADFLKVCNDYDVKEVEKYTSNWDYDNAIPYTYLGNIGGDWIYNAPSSEDRIGIQCSFNEVEKEIHVPVGYTHGYDRHQPDALCEKIIKFLRFEQPYQADVNLQPVNVLKCLHYDNMSTFFYNNKEMHSLPFDKVRRQPEHPLELRRIFVALQDWQDGWIFQMGTKQWAGWKKGDVIDFHWRGQPHSTANAGFSDRALLKISGFTDIDYFGTIDLEDISC